ncbi:hypothetical protein Fluta_0424 [Fluviicola taffensis DSM 16823]|uniref:Uncharacterized protein n=2 Tax=Fluviicola TaxID=332102 RepID=F2IEW6_FLUTR|nr:hypothetical protein Fluta_0424 [Fluviicola taffensis DSM 16823]
MIDPLTGEEFEPKRTNQKFASQENRIRFNNNKAKKLRDSMSFVNAPLQQNLRILNELLEGIKEAVVHIEFLNGKNFHFGVFTHIQKVGEDKMKMIYQYGLQKEGTDTVKIINTKWNL